MTPREIAEARCAHLDEDARGLFLRWFETGRSDAFAAADTEHVYLFELRALDAPSAAVAGYLEGLAAHRAQVAAVKRARGVAA
jgi:hypothetical protein